MSLPARQTWHRSMRVIPLLLFVVLLWLLTIAWPVPLSPQLDPGWRQVLSEAWLHGWRFGTDIVFTWGPLGWWMHPNVIPEAIAGKLQVELPARFALACLLGGIAWSLPRPSRILWCATLLVGGDSLFDAVILALVVALALLWMTPETPRWRVLVAITALGALAVVKFTTMVLVAGATGVASMVAGLEGRPRRALLVAAGVPAAIVTWWLLAGQHLADFWPYIRTSLHLAAGYGGAMALNETDLVWRAGLVVLAGQAFWILATAWRARTHAPTLVRLSLLALAVFLAWKHGYTRADAHVLLFFGAALWLSLVATGLPLPARLPVPLGAGLAFLSLAAFGITYPDTGRRWLDSLDNRIVNSTRRLTDLATARQSAPATPAVPANLTLPVARERIGEAPVDILGYEQGLLHLNGLTHRPRPVFQSYVAYTGPLAEINRLFFHSPGAPDYLLAGLRAIDGHYPAHDDSGVLRDLPFVYEPVVEDRGYLLMRRREPGSIAPVTTTEIARHDNVRPGDTVPLPDDRSHPLWMTIDSYPTLRTRLRGLFYREPQLWITLTDDRGQSSRWRIVPRLAEYGFLVQPRLVDQSDLTAWASQAGRNWNASIAVGTPPGDTAAWDRFSVTFHRLSLPLAPAPPAHILVTQGVINAEPTFIDSPLAWRTHHDDLGPRLFLHAPGRLDLAVPPGARQLRGEFGLEPGSYAGDNATDGVTFVVEAVNAAGQTVLWERRLEPLTRPGDRGRQSFELALPEPLPETIRIRLDTGPAGQWDWSYLARIRFEPEPVSATTPGAGSF